MDIVKHPNKPKEILYGANLLGSIRQILTGLQGFDSMAREIIQNADDAGADTIRFDIGKTSLRIWNNAKFESCDHGLESDLCEWETKPGSRRRKACDFHAISTVSSSNKYLDPDLIGRFGIGFVSVYQITDTPIIRSLDVQLELDPLRGKSTITTIPEIVGSEFELPWAYDPNSPVREKLHASAINPSDREVLRENFVRVAKDCLLFLRNLKTIEIFREGVLLNVFKRQDLDKNRILLSHQPEGISDEWFIIGADADKAADPLREKYVQIEKLGRQTTIQIAFIINQQEPLPGRIFAYLPTEQQSPIPCHINADFFPEQNRKALVLSGEQHERYWNEMLLGVAAQEIAKHLLELRDVLKPDGLWHLIGEAFEKKDSPHFGVFWNEIFSKASDVPLLWTSDLKWIEVKNCMIGPTDISDEQEKALAHIGLNLTHRSIRPYQNAQQSLGVKRLKLSSLVSALEEWDEILLDDDLKEPQLTYKKLLPALWSLTNSLLPNDRKEMEIGLHVLKRLKGVRIAPGTDKSLQTINDLYRLPSPVKNAQISSFVRSLPLVLEDFQKFDRLWALIDKLTFPKLLVELAAKISSELEAKEFFGTDKKFIRNFYSFLSSFPREEDDDISPLISCPILIGHGRFLPPNEAVLPGGFTDPVGRFDTLDVTCFDDRSKAFLTDVLLVQVLTLRSYVIEHLSSILASELNNDIYVALIVQLADHRELLEEGDVRSTLSNLELVRTFDGQMRRPKDCYFKTKELSEILGNDESLWVDTSLFSALQKDIIQIFFSHLGMRNHPSIGHALNRIDTIVEHKPSEQTVSAIFNLFHFLFLTFEEEGLAEREDEFEEEIERLRYTDWLPAVFEGELDTTVWYSPHQIYQPFRSSAFESQVPVLATRSDRKRRFNRDFLGFLEMPAVPSTSTVVNHLNHCIDLSVEANDTVYQVLTEKLKDEEDIQSLEQLRSSRCVYSSKHKKYVHPGRVFWTDPRLPRYCFAAPEWMHRHKELFDFLGVNDALGSETYTGVLIEIAEEFGGNTSKLPTDIQLIHDSCLRELAAHIRSHPDSAPSLLSELDEQPFLITLAGTLAFSDEVAVRDNEWLVEAFSGELDAQLVYGSPEHADVLDYLRIPRLSAVTGIEVVRLGEEIPDEDAADIFRERSPLLLRLLSSIRTETRDRISAAFSQIEIARTDFIQVRSVFSLTDPPIVSTPKSVKAHFNKDQNKLYLHLDLGDVFWSEALKAMVVLLAAGDDDLDIRNIAFIGKQVLQALSYDHAKRDLEEAGFDELTDQKEGTFDFVAEDLGDIADDNEDHQQSADEDNIKDLDEDVDSSSSELNPHVSDQITETEGDEGTGGPGTTRPPESTENRPNHEDNRSEPRTSDKDVSDENAGPSRGSTCGSPISRDHDEYRKPNRRTEWMRSYVVPKTEEDGDRHTKDSSGSQERNAAIDEAAMRAVIEFETNRRCIVERMPHFNPGYDVISKHQDTGGKRLIEVKGLDGPWIERGVKLTRTQIMNAEEYGEEFWLHVVEHALDDKNRKVYAINNPFFKASEFWFDEAWKQVVDETGGDLKSRFVPGRKVRVEHWGIGTITDVKHRGIASNLTIDFPTHGLKYLSLNLSQMELVED
jgi:hypothetical protein